MRLWARSLISLVLLSSAAHGQALFQMLLGQTTGCTPPPTTNFVGWYKADTGVTGTSPVTAWTDGSPAGNNLTGHGGLTLVTGQINGLPGITFNGSTGYFSGASVAAGDTSIYVVLKLNFTAANGYLTSNSGSAGAIGYVLPNTSPAVEQALVDTGTLLLGNGTASSDTNWHQLNVVYTDGLSGSVVFRIDRTADPTTSPATVTNIGFPIDQIGKSASEFLNATVEEILLYKEASSGGNKTLIETYLNCRTGL